jgi:hypothetical protein
MVNKEKVFRFLEVQELVNREIDIYGEASSELVDQLDQLGDDLSADEIEFLVEFTSQSK